MFYESTLDFCEVLIGFSRQRSQNTILMLGEEMCPSLQFHWSLFVAVNDSKSISVNC